ncbi:alpha/beta-hydrolase [Xylariaceae sp. FL0255]|nr:alpha/beta-hydrolase [Xylariaceae sp. FL0255]
MTGLLAELIFGARRPTDFASRPSVPGILTVAAVCLSVGLIMRPVSRSLSKKKEVFIQSPQKSISPVLPKNLPYPPDALPGARDVETPYGSIRVYEWGPEDGDRVLFVHGISTPVIALGGLGHDLVARGKRVMMFDLFGRGYSDAPSDLTYDARLYTTQILLVLASSNLAWTTGEGFHLLGYSLGGGITVAFARYFPHLLRSLSLIAPSGLIRKRHVGWRSSLYYNSGLLPEFLVRYLVRRRIRPTVEQLPAPTDGAAGGTDIARAETTSQPSGGVKGDGDSNGGKGFNSAAVSKNRPHVTVSSVVAWQVDHHKGFLTAFLSTIRNAPIYAPSVNWEELSEVLAIRRNAIAAGEKIEGLEKGKVFIVLGEGDGVICKDEIIADATAVLGYEGVEFVVLPDGHELPFTNSEGVAERLEAFWQ